jgi:SAM-dependent methyltransferase
MTQAKEISVESSSDVELLLVRGANPHRPSLENRVAFQWEMDRDTLGHRNGSRKDRLTLQWLADAVGRGEAAGHSEQAVLDVGCAYGNVLLMLNAFIGKRASVRYVGVDLHEEGMQYARAFAAAVPGYENCEYQVADLSKRLPFPDDTFDAINLGDVLEHMEDPAGVIRELVRASKPGGSILICTPLKGGFFKAVARAANWLSGGRLYRKYYKGKETDLDESGRPVMITKAGHAHISEQTIGQLRGLLRHEGLVVEKCQMMSIMSGSKWFDQHPFIMSGIMFLEAIHDRLQLASWAHGVFLLARVPDKSVRNEASVK